MIKVITLCTVSLVCGEEPGEVLPVRVHQLLELVNEYILGVFKLRFYIL